MTARSPSARSTIGKLSVSRSTSSSYASAPGPAPPTETTGPVQPSSFPASSGEVTATRAPESARMWRTSSGFRRKITGTITAPSFRIAAYACITSGRLGGITPTPVPGRAERPGEPVRGALLLDVGPLASFERERHVLAVRPDVLLAERRQVH